MQRTQLVFASAMAALGGAVSGAAINTTPLARGADAWEQVPRSEITAAALEQEGRSPAPPDHYPLITPRGRIEVAELREHGLYRNRRYGVSAGWYEPAEEPSYAVAAADYEYVPDTFDDVPQPAPVREAAPEEPTVSTRASAPLAVQPPATLAVTPRTIDVAAALAGRQ